ncbi:MAG TPA: tyrosine-type recombinase/integrase [Geobacteraceae bacterium]
MDWRPKGRNGPHPQRHFPGTEAEALAFHMEMVRISRQQPVSKTNPRVREVLPDWMDEYKNEHEASTCKDVAVALTHLIPFFGPLYLAELAPSLIEQYKGQRLTQLIAPARRKSETDEEYAERRAAGEHPPTKRTINKELCYLSGFLRWCNDNGYCDLNLKVRLFPAKQTKAPKPRPLHPLEVDRFYSHIEEQYQHIFLLYNDAGLRRSEVLGGGKYLGLHVHDIDLQFNIIYVRGKGDKERIVPITTARLRQSLEKRIKEVKRGHLSINPKSKKPYYSIFKALRRAAEKAGIEKRVYHHLLRHNFGTHATAAGVNRRSLQLMMGHSTSQVTDMYSHAEEFLQQEAAKLAAFTEPNTRSAKKNSKPKPRKAAPKQKAN